jgi:hypothetical protein
MRLFCLHANLYRLAFVRSRKVIHTVSARSFRTSKKTQPVFITITIWLMLFGKITVVYSENHTKPTNDLYFVGKMQLIIVKANGSYSYHWGLQGNTVHK